jgi:3-mercaptopyruvate sulfurtransferase SseA
MQTVTRDEQRALLDGQGCTRSKVTAAAFERLGYRDVRVYPGGKADWWQAGQPLVGHRSEAGV